MKIETGQKNKQKALECRLKTNYFCVCLLFVLEVCVSFKFPSHELVEI